MVDASGRNPSTDSFIDVRHAAEVTTVVFESEAQFISCFVPGVPVLFARRETRLAKPARAERHDDGEHGMTPWAAGRTTKHTDRTEPANSLAKCG